MNGPKRTKTFGGAARWATHALAALAASLLLAAWARGQADIEELDRAGGRGVRGRIEGDARSGFRFAPRDGGSPIALEPGVTVLREARDASAGGPAATGLPPFQLMVGEAARLSGSIRALTKTELRWAPGWQAGEVAMPRGCVQAIVQRPGEARVLADGFETIDAARWSVTGTPATAERPRLEEGRSLRLPAEGASLSHNLEEPLSAGRLDLAFHDDGTVFPGRECTLEPIFRGPTGPTPIRIILGWSEESLGVETPSGPTLQIQRLARVPGWHRLTMRFGPGEIEISVDGKELAHGRAPGGPLCAIRLATRTTEAAATGQPPSAYFDDLRLSRFAEPPGSLEIDVNQDEARLLVGDQIFGDIRGADTQQVVMAVEGRPISLPWGEVAGLYLRRVPAQGAPVDGLLVRAEWQTAPGERPTDFDFAEGALLTAAAESLTLATPYAGTLTIPRGRLRRLAVLGRGRRIVLDVAAHHLGDEISVTQPLDPPQPEGLTLERTIELAAVPDGPVALVLDVVQVVPEAGDSEYSLQVRKGELRTYVAVNGKRGDYLNRHIKTSGDTPERIRIPIPGGLLHTGKNTVRIELTGDSDPQPKYDDLGILQMAVEFPAAGAARPGPP
jgi:hypothetical protein